MGTPLYVSPEMLSDNISTNGGDFWALGCIIYQMLVGDVPFKAQHDYQTFKLIMERNLVLPPNMHPDAKDIIDKFLTKEPHLRLGCGEPGSRTGIQAAKKHPFFKKINFNALSALSPPVPLHKMSDQLKNESPPKMKSNTQTVEIKKGKLKKRNEFFMH